MGIISERGKGWIESRTKSVVIAVDDNTMLEVDYIDLDRLQELVELAQVKRRDK